VVANRVEQEVAMKSLSVSRSLATWCLPIWCVLEVAVALPLAGQTADAGVLLALSSASAPAAAPPPVMPGTWQLAGFDPGLPSTDLQPLRKLVGKAQLVGLGESLFTSGGFHQMRHRVTRYLVETLGFRMVAIESPWVAAQSAAAFAERCEGSPDDALLGLYPTWQSVEMRELLQWLCDWNQSHPKAKDKVRLTGFDVHAQSAAVVQELAAFLAKLDWAEDDPRSAGLPDCVTIEEDSVPGQVPPALHAACIGSLDAISQHFTANAKAIAKKTGKADFEWAKLRLVNLRADIDQIFYVASNSESHAARNAGLAYNVVKLRELISPKAKMVVWAYNGQLAKGGPSAPPWDFVAMGALLRASQGTRWLSIALAAGETAIDWQGVGCGPVADFGGPGSYEQALHDHGLGGLLVDLRANGAVPQVLPEGDHALGDGTIDIRRQFDALIYLDVSPRMEPLAWPPCQ
jgi:erythromycin esterase